jgi:hypothetical protein
MYFDLIPSTIPFYILTFWAYLVADGVDGGTGAYCFHLLILEVIASKPMILLSHCRFSLQSYPHPVES